MKWELTFKWDLGCWRALHGHRKSFCCAVWGIFSEPFCIFPLFFLGFIIPFLQGPQIPSQCSASSVKWRPIYTRYLRMCGPEIKHTPHSPKPLGVTFTEHREPGAKSHFWLHNYWGEKHFKTRGVELRLAFDGNPTRHTKSLPTTPLSWISNINANSESTYFCFVYPKPQISHVFTWKYSFLNENTFTQQNLLKICLFRFLYFMYDYFAWKDFCVICIL